MKTMISMAALLAALPAAALAQVSYSQARIADPAWPGDYRACVERSDTLADRKAFLDREKYDIDDAAADIAREAERLRFELQRLPASDAAAVADYNVRSADHNRRVAAHNRRVADMNAAAALHNGDSADMLAYCNLRTYRWREDLR
jgi:hypothetical protein